MKPTLDQIMEAVRSAESLGFCTACGAEVSGVEPDAREYECEECGAREVYGAEELLIMECGGSRRRVEVDPTQPVGKE